MKKFEVVVMSVLTLLFVGTLLHNGQSTKTPESWEKDVKQFGTTVTAKKENRHKTKSIVFWPVLMLKNWPVSHLPQVAMTQLIRKMSKHLYP